MIYPFLDFFFFRLCKKNNIPIGLFYRDIYWKFPQYMNKGIIKNFILKVLFKFDLVFYRYHINMLYLPSIRMNEYINIRSVPVKTLPPGISSQIIENKGYSENKLSLIYVGGIGNHYQIHKLLRAVNMIPGIDLVICCRKEEWVKNKIGYAHLVQPNISIEHAIGKDLSFLYQKANIACCFFENSIYRNFAMPLKLFEYLSFCKPVIATKGTAVGDFVDTYDIGWAIPYDEKALLDLLEYLQDYPHTIQEKMRNIAMILPLHTWNARVKQVCMDLVGGLEGEL